MMRCHSAFTVLLFCLAVPGGESNSVSRSTTSAYPVEKKCKSYTQTGKGNFKLQRKHYTSQVHEHFIKDLQLLKRTSFYQCEPVKEKFGIEVSTNTWWVDKGCEGVFLVVVCPDSGEKRHPHPENWRGTVYSEILLHLQEPVKPIDWKHFSTKEVEHRFEYDIPGQSKKIMSFKLSEQ